MVAGTTPPSAAFGASGAVSSVAEDFCKFRCPLERVAVGVGVELTSSSSFNFLALAISKAF